MALELVATPLRQRPLILGVPFNNGRWGLSMHLSSSSLLSTFFVLSVLTPPLIRALARLSTVRQLSSTPVAQDTQGDNGFILLVAAQVAVSFYTRCASILLHTRSRGRDQGVTVGPGSRRYQSAPSGDSNRKCSLRPLSQMNSPCRCQAPFRRRPRCPPASLRLSARSLPQFRS